MKYSSLCFVFLAALVAGCNKEAGNQPYGEVKGVVRISDTDNAPPYPLYVSLFRQTPTHLDSVTSQTTGAGGTFDFAHLDTGQYLVSSNADLNYGTGFSVRATVTSSTPSVTIVASISPYHYLYPDTVKAIVDTSLIGGTSTWVWLMNIGTRDSLVCRFDTSQVPSWIHVYISKTVFPPVSLDHFDPNFSVGIESSVFRRKPWPEPIAIPYQTQFENGTLYISFVFASQ
jgi:hypothetical protein